MRRIYFALLLIIVFALLANLTVFADAHNTNEYADGEGSSDLFTVACIACVMGLLVGFVSVSFMRSKLKSVRSARNAANYVKIGSFSLKESRDIFLYSTVTRVPKPKSKDSKRVN